MQAILERLKKRFLYKIRYQITILLFFVTFLPIVFIQLLNYAKTSELLLAKNQSILDDNLQLTQSSINNVLGDYRHVLFQMSTDVTCMDNILQLSKVLPESAEYRRISESLETYIQSNILLYPEIQALGVISTTGTSYLYVQKREKNQAIMQFFAEEKNSLNDNLLDSSTPYIDTISSDSSCYDEENPIFYLGSRTIHYEKMKITGSIILFISPSKLNGALNNPDSQVYPFTDKLLVDATDRIICSKESLTGKPLADLTEYPGLRWESVYKSEKSIWGTHLISGLELEYFNLKLINMVDYGQMNHDLQSLWLTTIVIISAILIAAILLAYLLCRRFIISVENIAKTMNLVDEKHLDIRIQTMSKNELRTIEVSFNRMIIEIKKLLEENKLQCTQISNAELKSLELQINPHFLFNTIDSINWMAIQENSLDVSEQLSKLAHILRHTVYHMNSAVPLKEEINWMINYLDLQKKRFGNKFTYDIFDLTGNRTIYIHKLLLQPFLENALVHGFENISYKGHLEVSCRIIGHSYLSLQVSDNGSGLTLKEIRQVNELFLSGTNTTKGVGLSNIAYRTKGYYPHSRIFACAINQGTCFKFFIPLDEMEG